jgi:hypothetical protein
MNPAFLTTVLAILSAFCTPCLHSLAHPRVTYEGDDLQLWNAAANVLNRRSRTADRKYFLQLGVWALVYLLAVRNKFVTSCHTRPETWTDT